MYILIVRTFHYFNVFVLYLNYLIYPSAIPCPPHPKVEHAYYTDADKTATYGDSVTYTCKRDYWLAAKVYALTIACSAKGVWEPEVSDIGCTGE